MQDPWFGVITYHFEFETNKWVKGVTKVAKWDIDIYNF